MAFILPEMGTYLQPTLPVTFLAHFGLFLALKIRSLVFANKAVTSTSPMYTHDSVPFFKSNREYGVQFFVLVTV